MIAVIKATNYLAIKVLLDEAMKVAQEVGIEKVTPKQIGRIKEKHIRNPLSFWGGSRPVWAIEW